MDRRYRRSLVFAVLALLGIAACSDVPQETVQTARTSLESARAANADTYAPVALATAEETLTLAEAELAAQSQKLGLLRSYGKVEELMARAAAEGETARQEAVAAENLSRETATAAIDAVRNDLQLTRELLASAPAGKDTRAEIQAMQQELAGLQAALDVAGQYFAEKDYLGARAKAEQVSGVLTEMRDDINDAIARARTR